MAYELRINRVPIGIFASPDEALVRAQHAVQERPDCEPEILDTETGRAFEPGATKGWRDELANKIGY